MKFQYSPAGKKIASKVYMLVVKFQKSKDTICPWYVRYRVCTRETSKDLFAPGYPNTGPHSPLRLQGVRAVLRIRHVYLGSRIRIFSSRIPDPGSKRFRIPDPGSVSASKNLSISTQINVLQIWSGMFIPDPLPGSGSWFFIHHDPGSRGQKGTASRIRIRNTRGGTVTMPTHIMW